MSTRSQGNLGEDRAVLFLKSKKYKILDRNVRSRFGEIDIVAKDGDCIVFAEVKMRTSRAFGTPREAITPQKITKIMLSAEWYLQMTGQSGAKYRIDALEVIVGSSEFEIVHLPNVTM